MDRLSEFVQSKRANIYSGIILATIWSVFAYAHLKAFQNTQNWTLLLFCFSETLTASFYLFRSDPKTVSVEPFDWIVAIGGTFAPLFLRPAAWGIFPYASFAIILGICIQIMGLISLNRSFAIVAAKREIKSEFMYRIVRHPIYASYCLMFTGYVLTNTSVANVVIYFVSIVFLCIRIFREEKHLSLDPQYRDYMNRVRYRLLPYVF